MSQEAKYDITQLWPIALVILVLGIGLAFSLDIVDDINDDFITDTAGCNSTDVSSCGNAYNATEDTMSGLSKFGEKMGTIVTIVIAVIIIGLVRMFGAQAR